MKKIRLVAIGHCSQCGQDSNTCWCAEIQVEQQEREYYDYLAANDEDEDEYGIEDEEYEDEQYAEDREGKMHIAGCPVVDGWGLKGKCTCRKTGGWNIVKL